MQLQPIGKFVLAQNKTLHNETKSSFASRGFTLWLSVGILENGYNYSFSRVKTICPGCFADKVTGHQACTFMHPKYRTPSVAINAHQFCSSTYHLEIIPANENIRHFLLFTQYRKAIFGLVSTNQSNRHDTPARHVIKKSFYRIYPQNTRN